MGSKSLFDAAPTQKKFLFECDNKQPFDKNKEVLLVITKNDSSNFNYLFGFVHEIVSVLRDEFNVVIISNNKNTSNIPNVYTYNLSHYNSINQNQFKRKKEFDGDNVKFNQQILEDEFEKSFDFNVDKIIFAEDMWHMLPRTSYIAKSKHALLCDRQNEFHDYVGNDKKFINLIDEEILKINENFNSKVSILAFSMYRVNMMQNLVIWFHKKQTIKMLYTFNIDPATYLYYFDYNKIPNTKFYFENDTRGTRNFSEFPISHLQHLIYEPKKLGKLGVTKKIHDFFFMGTILQQKGGRVELWKKFFRDLRIENSSLFIPDRANGIFKNKKAENSAIGQKNKKKAQELFKDTLTEMENNPMWVGHVLPDMVRQTIAEYKYGFIAKCTSHQDSLNYRPVFYISQNVLPFLDVDYDPEYLQIPKHIQERLVCKTDKDIKKWTKFYNEHDEERRVLIHDLYEHFKIDNFLENWESKIKKYFL